MSFIKIILTFYGLFLLFGAYMGWKKGSKISLMMGCVSGVLILFFIYLTSMNALWGYRLIAGLSGFLSLIFLIRLIKTKKFMPSGMLLVGSVIAWVISFLQ